MEESEALQYPFDGIHDILSRALRLDVRRGAVLLSQTTHDIADLLFRGDVQTDQFGVTSFLRG